MCIENKPELVFTWISKSEYKNFTIKILTLKWCQRTLSPEEDQGFRPTLGPAPSQRHRGCTTKREPKKESATASDQSLYRKLYFYFYFLISKWNRRVIDIATAIKRSNVPWPFIVEECPHRASVATVTWYARGPSSVVDHTSLRAGRRGCKTRLATIIDCDSRAQSNVRSTLRP